MMGNYQVRFLGELQLVTVAAYPALLDNKINKIQAKIAYYFYLFS